MKRLALFLALALLVSPGCGGDGGGSTAGILPGPAAVAIPFLPVVGETTLLDLKNLSADPAPVVLTAFPPAGAPGTVVPIPSLPGSVLPPFGEARFSLAGLPAGGWLHVETRDPVTLAPLPTTGFVVASFYTSRPGPAAEGAPGSILVGDAATISVVPGTRALQVVNGSRDAVTPATFAALDVVITAFASDGTVASTTPDTLLAGEALDVALPVGFLGSVEVVAVDAAGTIEEFSIAAREEPSSLCVTYDVVDRADLPFRLTEMAVEFGLNPEGGFRDFAFVVTNTADAAATFTVEQIVSSTRGSVLAQSVVVGLGAHETRFFATRRVDSLGMETGEIHPFEEPQGVSIFGDVFLATSLELVRMSVSLGEGILLNARVFDPSIGEHCQESRPGVLTHDAVAVGIPQETSLASGRRNWISLLNRTSGSALVTVRAFTPGGAEHILPSLTVGPYERLEWSPDGIVLNGLLGIREDQNDPTQPAVPFFSLRFTSAGSLGYAARREIRDAGQFLILVTPIVVEPIDD